MVRYQAYTTVTTNLLFKLKGVLQAVVDLLSGTRSQTTLSSDVRAVHKMSFI